jgi:NitT/TauT family transport system substrate-binding protein
VKSKYIAAIVSASLTLTAGSALAATKLKFGYSAASAFASAFVAADQGIFAKHGLDVEMVLVPNSSTTPAALVSDSLQVATPTVPVTLQAIENGLDLVVLTGGAVTDKNATDASVLAREGANIKTAKDFEGKKVATPGLNGFLHVLFREWMSKNGGDWKKVTFVESSFAQLGDILKAGQVDAIVTGDPFKTRALEAKQGYLVANYVAEAGDGIVSGWFIASRKWANDNKEAAAAFQVAIREATDLANKDPAVLRKAIGVYTKLPEAVLAQIPLPTLNASMSNDKVDTWSKMCVSQGLTKRPSDGNRIIWK